MAVASLLPEYGAVTRHETWAETWADDRLVSENSHFQGFSDY
jgi:hypothetical protein